MTRSGQRSQIAARAVQLTAVFPIPTCRSLAEAAFAIADEIERNELVWQLRQAIDVISDLQPASLKQMPVGDATKEMLQRLFECRLNLYSLIISKFFK